MESPSPRSRYVPQNSKKRVFPGGSSSCMEADVVEISRPPSTNRSSKKSLKLKEVFYPEVIDLDLDDDLGDIVQIDEKVLSNGKGKGLMENLPSSESEASGSVTKPQSQKSFPTGTENVINIDDMFTNDLSLDEEYAMFLQTQFDSFDMPTSIEAQIPLLHPKKNHSYITRISNNSLPKPKSNILGIDSVPVGPTQTKSSAGSSSSNRSHSKRARSYFSGQLNRSSVMKGHNKPYGSHFHSYMKKTHFTGNLNLPGTYSSSMNIPQNYLLTKGVPSVTNFPPPAGSHSWGSHVATTGSPFYGYPLNNPLVDPTLTSSEKVEYDNIDEIMQRFKVFKNFDTVQDSSDHYFHNQNSSITQPAKNWSKKIQDEWKILEKDLPDTIFVRVYESRMDILRAVIIGAEGTPYHDGLFFFDVFFPSNYPSVPPKVHYHSGGLRINPNLYNCGKVCLSLLNTWSGSQKEKWIPKSSTMLQVLVSIQGLILNTKPYFNEPGYASSNGSIHGEKSSLQYNERTLILSLKTMVYSIRRPPKYFEDFVAGHFSIRAHDILMACQAYIEGAQVGCLVKGGVQDVDESDKSCSQEFKRDVASFVKTLVDAFKQVGAKDCDKFIDLASKVNNVLVGPGPGQGVVLGHGHGHSIAYC